MREIKISLAELGAYVLPIGRVGEKNTTTVRIDCAELYEGYPGATVGAAARTPTGTVYPLAVSLDETDVVWVIHDSDLTESGYGAVQFTFATTEEGIIKTIVGKTQIGESLIENATEPPDPIENWIDDANEVLSAAQEATGAANDAATLANTKAGLANTAAGTANTAAAKIDDMTVAASGLAAGAAPTATITEVNGHKHVAFGIPKGDTGDAFHIVKTYASVAAMNADYSGTDTHVGDYVMIVSTVEDPDNAKVYIKGSSAWSFVVDMSGATGIQGQAAYVHIRWAANEPTQDSDMETTADKWIGIYSGTSSTPPTAYTSYTWYQYKGDKGDTGNTGATGATGADGTSAYVWIRYASQQPTQDSDMETTADDWIGIYSGTASTAPTTYTSYTWYKIKGETGSATNVYGTTVPMSEQDSTKVATAINAKTDKVTGATNGHFAGLDSNGNLTDSGSKASDFLTSHQDISGKADKVASATSGNFAGLDANGNLTDSGHKHSDYLTAHQDISGKADKVSSATSGDFAGLDANGNLTDSGKKASDFVAASDFYATEMPMSDQDSTKVSAKIGDVADDVSMLAESVGIVVDGNTSALGASSGQYVILRNSTITGCADGLYTAAQAIPANTAIDSTYLTAVSGGGLNALSGQLQKKTSFTKTDGSNANRTNITVPTVAGGVFLIVAGQSITSVNTDGNGDISNFISFAESGHEATKVDAHTMSIWSGSWYRSVSILRLC